MPKSLKILVTGATGHQGGALARSLLKKGHTVRALTRNPGSPAGQALKEIGAQVVAGDFTDREILERAMKGVDAVFAMTVPWNGGQEGEIAQGRNLVDAAKAVGVSHFLYSSVASANRGTGVPHFDSKAEIESHIRASGLPFTIIAPVTFMENALSPWIQPELRRGRLPMPLPAGRSLQQIALDDIAGFATLILERREPFLGQRFDIASDEIDGKGMSEILSQVAGREIRYQPVPIRDARGMLGEAMAKMFEWLDRVGYDVNIPELRRQYPEVDWHTYESWAKTQDWSMLLRAA